ncbi:MAG: carbohydrate binding family 9 domain-containing protein, partial [Acidobacteria bacterium]|nr:carbohydrate binding family 9 domain-containing protein [Acidobacteriota bacterium]
MTITFTRRVAAAFLLLVFTQAHTLLAQTSLAGETLHISRATGSIKIDGELSDEGWKGAVPVATWYEVNPGDNTPPKVRNIGRIAYDDRFLYAAFEFDDPNPRAIRAPYSDRDDSGGGFYDFGGMFVDAGDSGRTATLFAVTPRNIQQDSVIDDASGEAISPDFFWESATKITARGWTLEMRIPFTSLRYQNGDPQTWAILMYRNYPRENHYQFFSAKLPRGYNCLICHANTLEGLQRLPGGGHLVAAPYVSSTSSRSFFLEGVDLLQTPIQAVYTRTVTAPAWGGRITGKEAGVRYTALVVEDEGGGSVVLPGARGSSFASQDFASTVFVARAKRDLGRSFVGALVTDREGRESASYNRVLGPDFQWRPNGTEAITGQWLVSDTRTPNRPDLTHEWTGQSLTSHAGQVQWTHTTTRLDSSAMFKDVGDGFRAEAGFVPQVGYREASAGAGWTFRPTGFASKLRTFVEVDRQVDRAGELIGRDLQTGVAMNTRWNGFMLFRYIDDDIQIGNRSIGRRQLGYSAQFSPSRLLSTV